MKSLPEVMEEVAAGGGYESLADTLRPYLDEPEIETVFRALNSFPRLHVSATLLGREDECLPEERNFNFSHPLGILNSSSCSSSL